MSYYHCAPLRLGPGSIIMPGNWGRLVRRYLENDTSALLRIYREAALEIARQAMASEKPSRLDCVFACPDLETVRRFQEKHQPASVIHEIEPLEDSTPVHLSGLSFVDFPQPDADALFPTMENLKAYWMGPATGDIEVLIGGPVKVVAAIEP